MTEIYFISKRSLIFSTISLYCRMFTLFLSLVIITANIDFLSTDRHYDRMISTCHEVTCLLPKIFL